MTGRADALTWPETQERSAALLVVPLGATEQHGPHLPVSTDSDLAVALADRLAAARPAVLVAPLVAFGASGEHADFPGTLSIGTDVLRLLLVELCRSATRTWPRVLLLSAHGGNAEAVRGAVAQLLAESRDVRTWSPRWGGDAHAGRTETSLQLALAPERVRVDHVAPGATADLRTLLPELRRSGVRAVSANGVLGDPTSADAEHGAELLDAAVSDLVGVVDAWLAVAA